MRQNPCMCIKNRLQHPRKGGIYGGFRYHKQYQTQNNGQSWIETPRPSNKPADAASTSTRQICHVVGAQSSLLVMIAVLAGLLLSAPLSAQVKSAGIGGSIVDSTGAVVGGAEITVTEQATKTSVKAITTNAGDFSVRISRLVPTRLMFSIQASRRNT